jgi:nicotinate-nucleotide adenylyltransferase
MLELAIGGHEAFAVSDIEAQRGGISYTIDSLRHFRQADPDADLFFLMGADMLHDLPNWREAEEVCRLAIPVVVRRPATPEPDERARPLLMQIASPPRAARRRRCRFQQHRHPRRVAQGGHLPLPAGGGGEYIERMGQSRRLKTPSWVPRAVYPVG